MFDSVPEPGNSTLTGFFGLKFPDGRGINDLLQKFEMLCSEALEVRVETQLRKLLRTVMEHPRPGDVYTLKLAANEQHILSRLGLDTGCCGFELRERVKGPYAADPDAEHVSP